MVRESTESASYGSVILSFWTLSHRAVIVVLLYNSASGIGPVFILLGDFYMKKILILSIALAALIGCQKKEAPKAVEAPAAPAAEAPAAAPAAPATAPATDKK